MQAWQDRHQFVALQVRKYFSCSACQKAYLFRFFLGKGDTVEMGVFVLTGGTTAPLGAVRPRMPPLP